MKCHILACVGIELARLQQKDTEQATHAQAGRPVSLLSVQYLLSGIFLLSEAGVRGLLNLGEKAFGPSKLGKFDAVLKNWTAILNGLKTI